MAQCPGRQVALLHRPRASKKDEGQPDRLPDHQAVAAGAHGVSRGTRRPHGEAHRRPEVSTRGFQSLQGLRSPEALRLRWYQSGDLVKRAVVAALLVLATI